MDFLLGPLKELKTLKAKKVTASTIIVTGTVLHSHDRSWVSPVHLEDTRFVTQHIVSHSRGPNRQHGARLLPRRYPPGNPLE